ncbi:gamma-glutamyltransferase [Marivibrio halodurans]|uniref:Gamma-glutamyltransferase n=1 Tax=Marivibrio halodurans TaxID=2039722 RepID=A0A8J7S911_9PROT|nr:gamma-glutamyltransferase [Marivibrio halodurans]MBP5857662.1 gamma-glutamyltransferase [Marivibrio halodurans]
MIRRKQRPSIAPFFSRISHSLSLAFVVALAGALAGCAGDEEESVFGEVGYIQGFYGGLAVDEPNAALVGRDVLTAGGSAADAATAISLALSVTYPSAITLGGGGSCVVHDATLGVTEALDFAPGAGSGPAGGRPTAVPGLVRGLVALHARYGRLDWRLLVAPAEQLARLGHRASRAFTTELAPAAPELFRDEPLRRVFSGPGGQPLTEGERFQQIDLAGTLGRIRGQGGGVLYTGNFADRLVEAYREVGGTLTREDLREFIPEWRTTVVMPQGEVEMHFAPPPAQAGVVEAQVFGMLGAEDRYAEADPSERPHLLVEASRRALADRRQWLDGYFARPDWRALVAQAHLEDLFAGYDQNAAFAPGGAGGGAGLDMVEAPAGTGFVVVDRDGMAVACDLTNYYPFGIGRAAPGTGIIPAAAPTGHGRNTLALGPAIGVEAGSFAFRFAVAANGGVFSQATVNQIAADVVLRGEKPGDAVAAKRVLGFDQPSLAVVERGAPETVEALRRANHQVQETIWPARANVIHCPYGLPDSQYDSLCAVAHDPRGFGLSVSAPSEEN